ncbi:hypothetical protein [Variovorax boronicumulans]|uniref:hypothetical protein n=1 Tax=Variovorax boronicumulans TaxID=436515 RepID=UPI003F9768F8
MVDHVRVLVLRTEHHDLRVGVDLDVVAGRPIEQVVCLDGLLFPGVVGGGDLALEHEPPVRALAGVVVVQALEERRRVDARRQREVLAADLAVAGRVAEIQTLPDQGTGNFHLHVDGVFCDMHEVLLEGPRARG